ncbi:MAG: hypothetical protein ACEQSH_00265 [Bacteroidia bacterium]
MEIKPEWGKIAQEAWIDCPGNMAASWQAAVAAVAPMIAEECAKVAEQHPEEPGHGAAGRARYGQVYAAKHIAAAIRARFAP